MKRENTCGYLGYPIPKMKNKAFIVPQLVRECVVNIEKNCNLEGLFEHDKKNPYIGQIEQFKEQLQQVKKGSISTLLPNTHVTCGILKSYFMDLPSPLFPFDLIKDFSKENDKTESYISFIKAFQSLPEENQHLFAYIINFCYRLQLKQSRFTPELLGKALGSLLFRSDTYQYNSKAVDVLILVLKQYNQHFPKGTEVPVAPPAATVSIFAEDDTPGGYIAVRVNNYQVTSLIKGVQVKSVRALYRFDARTEKEISMEPGDIIEITYQDDQPGWWEGKLRGCTGLFPSNYCEVYEILKRKKRKMKIDTTKVSDRILLMQNALTMNRGGAEVEDESSENPEEQIEKSEEKKEELATNIAAQVEELPNLRTTKFEELKISEDINSSNLKSALNTIKDYHNILVSVQQILIEAFNRDETNEPVEFIINDTPSNDKALQKEKDDKAKIEEEKAKKQREQEQAEKERIKKEEEEKAKLEKKKKEEEEEKQRKEKERLEKEKKEAELKSQKQKEEEERLKQKAEEEKKKAEEESRKLKEAEERLIKAKEEQAKIKAEEKQKKGKKDKEKPKKEKKEKIKKDITKKTKSPRIVRKGKKKDKKDTKIKDEIKVEEKEELQKDIPQEEININEESSKIEESNIDEEKSIEPEDKEEPKPEEIKEEIEEEKPEEPKAEEIKHKIEEEEKPKEEVKQEVVKENIVEPTKEEIVEVKETTIEKEETKKIETKPEKAKPKSLLSSFKEKEHDDKRDSLQILGSPLLKNFESSAFQADKKLFDEFQRIQQLIEDERTRRAELDTAIDSTNQKIAVVISKFEGRCSEKDRLLRAVARHRQ